jgi:SAM-dependent methyltransferase
MAVRSGPRAATDASFPRRPSAKLHCCLRMDKTELQDVARSSAARDVCAVCAGVLGQDIVLKLRHYHFRICDRCGSWTCLPRPSAAQQAAIHDNEEYFDHPYFKLRRVITPAQRERCRGVFRCLAAAVDVASLRGERLLDIGCDTGVFLKAAKEEFGIIPVGIDVAARAVEEARRDGIEAYRTRLEEAPAELSGFAASTAIDLVEHVADPAAFLREVRGRLRPGGVVYLETPNIHSAVYRFGRMLAGLSGGRPAGLLERLFPPQHIQYFTAASFGDMAARAGLEVVSVSTRVLPRSHISASPAALLPIALLQAFDRLFRTEILVCSVLRRPR